MRPTGSWLYASPARRREEGARTTASRNERIAHKISALGSPRGLLGSLAHQGQSAALLVIMTTGYAVYAVDRLVLSAVLAPLSTSLALTNSQIGLLGSAQYIGVTCVVFAAGYLSDRFGRWPVLISGLAVFTAFTWLIGFSSSFSEAFLFRLVSGFGEGAFWPVAMASVAGYFKGRKGLALGIFYVGFDAGSVAGLSIGGVAYTLTSSWRPAFFFAPLIGLVVIAAALIARRRLAGSRPGLRRDQPRKGCAAALEAEKRSVDHGVRPAGDLGERLADRLPTILFLQGNALHGPLGLAALLSRADCGRIREDNSRGSIRLG